MIGDTKMTYKELLFKMADKGMLELSNKDERGLFWAGMNNMDALEQKVDLGDFTHNLEIVQDEKLGEQIEQIICDKQLNEQQGKITAKFNDIK